MDNNKPKTPQKLAEEKRAAESAQTKTDSKTAPNAVETTPVAEPAKKS